MGPRRVDAALESEIADLKAEITALKERIRELEAGPGTFSSAVRHALRLANDAAGWPPLPERAARKRSRWISTICLALAELDELHERRSMPEPKLEGADDKQQKHRRASRTRPQ
jgi:hypothetical protein